jgi:OOP family OmpA-OmpF porin
MKKIVLASGLLLTTLVSAQESYNKFSLDLGLGVNRAYRYQGAAKGTNFPTFNIGVRYMANNYFGVRLLAGFDQFKNLKDVPASEEFTTNNLRFNIEGVANLGRMMHFESFTNRLGLLIHAGPGGAWLTRKEPSKLTDRTLNMNSGITTLVRLNDRFTFHADMSTLFNIRQNRTFDMASNTVNSGGYDGAFMHWSVGLNIALGKNQKHADWIPNDGGAKDEIAALRSRLDKAESDMKDDDNDGVPNYLDEEKDTPAGSTVESKGRTVKSTAGDMDSDGIPDTDDLCPTISGSKAANGCPDGDGDGVADFLDLCPNEKGTKENQGCASKTNNNDLILPELSNLLFDLGKSNIKNKYKNVLDGLVKTMKATPNMRVTISGHTDNSDTDKLNNALSAERAENVKNYLVSKGIDASRLTTQGFGSKKPVASNETEEGRTQNRRVEFSVK